MTKHKPGAIFFIIGIGFLPTAIVFLLLKEHKTAGGVFLLISLTNLLLGLLFTMKSSNPKDQEH